MAVAEDGEAAEGAAEAVVAALVRAAVVGIAVAAVVVVVLVRRDELLRCLDRAVGAADGLAVVTAVVVDRVEVWPARARVAAPPVLVPVGVRCNDRKAIGKGSAACQHRIDQAVASVNGRVAAVRVLDLEQVARDRDRTLPVVAVRGPAAGGHRRDNSTTSWISVAAVGGHPLVGPRSPAAPAGRLLATRLTISCAIGPLVGVLRRCPEPRAQV